MTQPFTIGQLARRAGVSRDTIRFYEREALLPKAPRTPSGYRLYSPEAAERLLFIKRAQAIGFSLTEIRDLLEGFQDPDECAHVKDLLEQKIADLDKKIREIQSLRDLLGRYLSTCHEALRTGQATGVCPVLSGLLDGSHPVSP